MDLIVNHENYQINFILKDKKRIVDTFSFGADTGLAQNFLMLLDKFLKKCNTNIVNVENVKLQEGKSIGLTSSRIVETIIQTLQFVHRFSL